MANMPKITIHIDLDNLDKINDEVLLWELCRRHEQERVNKKVVQYKISVFGMGDALIMMTDDECKKLMGDWEIEE
jgi:hypothetical protein